MRAGIINFSPRSRARAALKMPNCQSKHAVPPPPKSQYELERDARIKRAPRRPQSSSGATSPADAARRVGDPHAGNKAVMASLGFEEGAPTLKAPRKPRLPKEYVPESERRRSPRLAGETVAPKRLTYDLSDDEGPKRRYQSSRRIRVRVVDDLSDEQRARLAQFNMDDFYASASAPFTKPRHRRDSVITLHIYTGFWSPTASTRSPTTTGARSSAR